MNREFDDIIDDICEKDKRYRRDAYEFIMEALGFTQKKMRRPKHITGEELLSGIREFLLERFGPMTLSVLNHWGVKTTEDFGNIVFNLVNHKVLSKTDEDSIESFKNGYDFNQVFGAEYQKQLHKKIGKMRS